MTARPAADQGRRDWRDRVDRADLGVLGEPMVGAEQVAVFLGVDRSTVYRLAGKAGGIPVVLVNGRKRFKPSDVRRYVEQNTVREVATTRAEKLLRSSS